MSRVRFWALSLLVPALALTGCTSSPDDDASPSPTPEPLTLDSCDELPARIADAVQAYVDSFADVDAESVAGQAASASDEFRSMTARLRTLGEQLGCDPDQTADTLAEELRALSGGSPVQDAVLATLVADPLGTLDPSDPAPVDLEVSTTTELVAAVSLAGSGSTIRLAAGTYVVGEPLVALRPLTLVGAGRDDTVIRSIAPGAAMLLDADGDVTIRDLTVSHDGSSSASVVVVTGGGYSFERLRVAGGVAADNGAGGFGIVVRSTADPLRGSGDRAEVIDTVLSDHEGGGLFVGNDGAPTLRDVTVARTGGCALCFVEQATGVIDGARVRSAPIGMRADDESAPQVNRLRVQRADIGVVVTGSAAPTVSSSRITDTRSGVEVIDNASPTLSDVTVIDSQDIGLRLAGSSQATVRRVRVTGAPTVGIGVADDAAPTLTGTTIDTSGDVGVIWLGQATGSADGLTVSGTRLGLQAGDRAAPTVTDATVRRVREAALLAGGSSAGTVTRLQCPADAPIALIDDTTIRIRQSPTCDTADAR